MSVIDRRANVPGLSAQQIAVADEFFKLDAADGFLVAGGAALIANGITERETKDLDFFTNRADVSGTVAELRTRCQELGWGFDVEHYSATFARVRVAPKGTSLDDAVIVELAVDAPPLHSPVVTILGPTIDIKDAAGQKTLALFGRAEPRDFCDVYDLTRHFSTQGLLELAEERDKGFNREVFAQMLGRLDRISDARLGHSEPKALREFYSNWIDELRHSPASTR